MTRGRGHPGTLTFPEPLAARRGKGRDEWMVTVDGHELRVTNLDKVFWGPEGYTKADLLGYYANVAPWVLPYVQERPLTLKRMPNGADDEFFYAKRAPDHTPEWMATASVVSRDTGKAIDYLLAQDRRSLLWLANLGCIELHPWHSRIDDIGRPDYAFFDLDPFDVGFDTVRQVALMVRTALDQLGLRGYPRTSGATGMQVYVPVDRVHTYAAVREWVGRVCELIHRADPERTTMEWQIANRTGKVFLDHNMNTEGKNIAATYSLRPERGAPVATPLRWEEVEDGVEPRDFTIETIWSRLDEVGDLGAPIIEGGQDLRAAMEAVGVDPAAFESDAGHEVDAADVAEARQRLETYGGMRDFAVTPEPSGDEDRSTGGGTARRFVIQHHLATRLHHDLRLERGGTLPSWAVPKGLPDVPGLRHLAVQTEDHPLSYLDFQGEIPEGEYGGGAVRIWDHGTYEPLDWEDGKVTFRLHGQRHRGTFHLFRTGGQKDWLVIRRDQPMPGDLPADPPRFEPMLATGGAEPFDDPAWLFEVKWDGVRALATVRRPGGGEDGSTLLCSRRGNDVTGAYPELQPLWERIVARNAVLDGEVVTFDEHGRPSFQRLQHRMHLREPAAVKRASQQTPAVYMVFDVLWADGEDLTALALTERMERLEDILVPDATVQRSDAVPGDGKAMFDAVRAQGLEGLIAKRASAPYRPGRRSRDWLKVKVRRSICCVVGGWLPGEKGRSGRLGALLVGLYEEGKLHYVGRVGTGFDDAELDRLGSVLAEREAAASPFVSAPRLPGARWVTPDLVCLVEYGEATDDQRLRAPAYKGLRPDSDPRACTLDELA